MAYEKKPRVRIGGLWLGKSGVITGNIGGLRMVIFPEKDKKSERSPDFTAYFEEAERKEGDGQRSSGGGGGWREEVASPTPLGGPPIDDDIPFIFQE